jgi:hypothetical protein
MLPLWAFHNAFGISKGLLLGIPRGQNDSLRESTRATFWDSQKEAFGDPKGAAFHFYCYLFLFFYFLFLIFIFVFLISHFCQKV